jgi:hypothetical protein
VTTRAFSFLAVLPKCRRGAAETAHAASPFNASPSHAMSIVAVISSFAVLAGIGGIFPQIVTMFQARSSAGQSAIGWCLGVLANGLLGYVNLVEAQSAVLAGGNAIGLALCVVALAQVVLYRSPNRGDVPATSAAVTVSDLLEAPHEALAELHTTELDAIRIVVSDAQEARRRHREPLQAAAA